MTFLQAQTKKRRTTSINHPTSMFQCSLIWPLYCPMLHPPKGSLKGPLHPYFSFLESTIDHPRLKPIFQRSLPKGVSQGLLEHPYMTKRNIPWFLVVGLGLFVSRSVTRGRDYGLREFKISVLLRTLSTGGASCKFKDTQNKHE